MYSDNYLPTNNAVCSEFCSLFDEETSYKMTFIVTELKGSKWQCHGTIRRG